MKLVQHPSHGKRVERRLLLFLVGSLVIALVGWLVSRNTTGNLSLAAMWTSVAVLSSFGTGLKLLQNYMSGNEGEDALVRTLELLGDEYTVVTNWKPPNEKRGDVDLIVLGPHGVAVLECKRYSGSFGCDGDFWYLQMENGYKKRIKRLSSQTRGHVQSVQRHLKRNKMTASVNGALVFASLRNATIVNPKAHIIDADDAVDFIYSLPRTGDVSAEWLGVDSLAGDPARVAVRQLTPSAAGQGGAKWIGLATKKVAIVAGSVVFAGLVALLVYNLALDAMQGVIENGQKALQDSSDQRQEKRPTDSSKPGR